jgi:hypothetical protein
VGVNVVCTKPFAVVLQVGAGTAQATAAGVVTPQPRCASQVATGVVSAPFSHEAGGGLHDSVLGVPCAVHALPSQLGRQRVSVKPSSVALQVAGAAGHAIMSSTLGAPQPAAGSQLAAMCESTPLLHSGPLPPHTLMVAAPCVAQAAPEAQAGA